MNRRDFLRGTGAVAAVAVLAPLAKMVPQTPPKLWGDGIHDDTFALQWRIDHGVPITGVAGQVFLTKVTIQVGGDGRITNAHFKSTADPVLYLDRHWSGEINNIWIEQTPRRNAIGSGLWK